MLSIKYINLINLAFFYDNVVNVSTIGDQYYILDIL